MTEAQALALFKCLADKSRLQILKSLAQEPMDGERLSLRLELSPATVSFHLKKLSDAGCVTSRKEQYYTIYSLNPAIFEASILSILKESSEQADVQAQRDEAFRRKVISSFFEYGKLVSIPAQRKKKRIILEVIAEKFEFDRDYEEKEVNRLISEIHEDFCTLRRDMISERLMERDRGIYRRLRQKEPSKNHP